MSAQLSIFVRNKFKIMKNAIAVLVSLLSFAAFGQDFHRCYTHEAMLEQEERTSGYIGRVDDIFERAKHFESQDREDVYTIPVVVHIVYNTEEENLADSVIFNQIESLNADYRRLNEDAENVRDTFNTIVGDTFIGFQLASFDPSGNPTNGITRTNTDIESFFSLAMSPAEGVKLTSEGGIDPWDQSRYLNIWVCDMSVFGTVFLLGYATPPDGLPHWPEGATDGLADGVVVQYEAFGSNNPNPLIAGGAEIDVRGRTTTHEVGHYLGLRHIWGDGDCLEQDGVDDTPNAEDQSGSCDLEKNTCLDDIADLGDLPDMVENYMDYSPETCQNSFTLGQVGIMRGVLEIERFDLVNDNPALGINSDQLKLANFKLYPNPSTGTVQFSVTNSDENGISRIEVLSETGQFVQSMQLSAGTSSTEIEGLPRGIYFVRLTNETGIRTEKLVIL